MPGHEDIRTLASRLAELYAELREVNLSIDQTVEKVTEAISLYRQFKKHFAKSEFDVRTVQRDSSGKLIEKSFDWQALDRVAS